MVANLFYHSHYREFLNRQGSSGNNANYRGSVYNRGHIQRAHKVAESSVLLNKNNSVHTLGFVRALTQNMVQLKDAALKFSNTAVNLSQALSIASYEKHLEWMDADLRRFTATYNNLDMMADGFAHARELGKFQSTIRNITQNNRTLLSHVGIVESNGSGLTYHGIGNASNKETALAVAEAFKTTYNATRDFLIHPMTAHMNFSDLRYYYNYTIGSSASNTVNLIESGLLVDFIM